MHLLYVLILNFAGDTIDNDSDDNEEGTNVFSDFETVQEEFTPNTNSWGHTIV